MEGLIVAIVIIASIPNVAFTIHALRTKRYISLIIPAAWLTGIIITMTLAAIEGPMELEWLEYIVSAFIISAGAAFLELNVYLRQEEQKA